MLRSMYAGISGMKNFQTKLDVIGNNIANVNTVGFKKGRVTFQDLMSQMTAPATGPTNNRGGINPLQVGLGSQIGSIDNIHTQGFRQTTNNSLDFIIEGDGMFVLASGISSSSKNVNLDNANISYTRAGNFYLDEQGKIVNSDGLYLIGYPAETFKQESVIKSYDASGNPIIISTNAITKEIEITTISDVTGKEKITKLSYDGDDYRDENNNIKNSISIPNTSGSNTYIELDSQNGGIEFIRTYENGRQVEKEVTTNDEETKYKIEIGTLEVNYSIDNEGNLWLIDGNKRELFTIDEDTGTFTAEFGDGDYTYNVDGSTFNIVNKNSNTVISTSFIHENEITRDVVDHSFTSTLTIPDSAQSFSVQSNGIVNYVDEHGATRVVGQIALASFSNPAGLQKIGSNQFINSTNAGFNGLFIPEIEGASIGVGSLEMSNVDLAEEFTEMITAQRGFQANTRMITTSDEILQELVNLKR